MATRTQETPEARAAREAREAEAGRLAEGQALRGAEGAPPVVAAPSDPAATTLATEPGVMTPRSTAPSQLAAPLAGGEDGPRTLTCGGCGAAWPADRLGAGTTVPCLCGRLLTAA